MLRQVLADGETIYQSDSGVYTSAGQGFQFVFDSQRRLQRVVSSNNEQVVLFYDEQGRLATVRRLGTGEQRHYGYETNSGRLFVIATDAGSAGRLYDYATGETRTVQLHLGSTSDYHGQTYHDTLSDGGNDYTLVVRESEIESTSSGRVLVRAVVRPGANSSLDFATPQLDGTDPLVTYRTGQNVVAVFDIASHGLHVLRVRSANGDTSGGVFSLAFDVVGDLDGNGLVDGFDAELLKTALGASAGQSAYDVPADANGNGVVDQGDVLLVDANLGWQMNRPPVIESANLKTHVDLPVTIALDELTSDPEGDAVYYQIAAVSHGTVRLNSSGQSLRFVPEPGFSGEASVSLFADDGFGANDPYVLSIEVSDAPLLNIEFVQRPENVASLEVGESVSFAYLGDFADESDVPLPPDYLDFTVLDPTIASVSINGSVQGLADGTTVLIVSRDGIVLPSGLLVGNLHGVREVFDFTKGSTSIHLPIARCHWGSEAATGIHRRRKNRLHRCRHGNTLFCREHECRPG